MCRSPADAPEEAAAAAAAAPEAAAAADEPEDTAVAAAEPAAAAAAAQAGSRAISPHHQCVRLVNYVRCANRRNSAGPKRCSASVKPQNLNEVSRALV